MSPTDTSPVPVHFPPALKRSAEANRSQRAPLGATAFAVRQHGVIHMGFGLKKYFFFLMFPYSSHLTNIWLLDSLFKATATMEFITIVIVVVIIILSVFLPILFRMFHLSIFHHFIISFGRWGVQRLAKSWSWLPSLRRAFPNACSSLPKWFKWCGQFLGRPSPKNVICIHVLQTS